MREIEPECGRTCYGMVGVATTVAVIEGVLILVELRAEARVYVTRFWDACFRHFIDKKIGTSLCMHVLLSETTVHRGPRMSRQMGMRCVMGSVRNRCYWCSAARFRG